VAYLSGQGVGASRLSARGYGKAQPIADTGTDAGRAQNRRVELKKLDEHEACADLIRVPGLAPGDPFL